MTPFVTLLHWDLPNCLQLEYGGMLSDEIVNDFVEFANLCFKEFDDQMYQNGQIGITLISNFHYPFDSTSQDDNDAVQRAFNFMLGCFLEPVIYGQFSASMLQYAKGNIEPFSDEEQQSSRAQLTGLVYTSDFVAYEKDPPGVGYLQINIVSIVTASSWMVPKGLYDHLHYLQNKYKQDMPPLYVTENGVADNNDHTLTAKQACVDTTRVQYYQDHLAYLLKAMNSMVYQVFKGQCNDAANLGKRQVEKNSERGSKKRIKEKES
ncbi:UNVERIFIED_CONTAM: Beta-glucosidase 13 [Sesamum latifolium]|uniref:beta-glucosidase n=1 Tax=Sesamum latifolium TaxID=2727402 RepID=A0AAW2UJN6_9LAMI